MPQIYDVLDHALGHAEVDVVETFEGFVIGVVHEGGEVFAEGVHLEGEFFFELTESLVALLESAERGVNLPRCCAGPRDLVEEVGLVVCGAKLEDGADVVTFSQAPFNGGVEKFENGEGVFGQLHRQY